MVCVILRPSVCSTRLAALRTLAGFGLLAALAASGAAQVTPGDVDSSVKVGDGVGGFTGVLGNKNGFGIGVAALGDVDGDGIPDVAVGANSDDDGGQDTGAVWVLFLHADGSVKASTKIGDLGGGLAGELDNNDGFGTSVAGLGDLDDDGVPDLLVGSLGDGIGGNNRGAAWVLFLQPDGSAREFVRISDNEGGFTGELKINDGFGRAVANLGDLDGDGVIDVAVSADNDSSILTGQGAVWLLLMTPAGTVKGFSKLTQDSFPGVLDKDDGFGRALAGLGDLDGDGVVDLAVGVGGDDDAGTDAGAVWLLMLNRQGGVHAHTKLSGSSPVLAGRISALDHFGSGIARLDDLDGDGVGELAVGAPDADDGGSGRGSLWVFFLDTEGNAHAALEQSSTSGSFGDQLADGDQFGSSLARLPDLDGDGFAELVVGTPGDAGHGVARGALYTLFLQDYGDEAQPYTGSVSALAGRPGRVGLASRSPEDGQDFIGAGVVIVPQSDGGLVRSQGVATNSTNTSGFESLEEEPTGKGPAQAGTGNFSSASDFTGLQTFKDVVTANRLGDSVSLLLGNGDGTFQPQQEFGLAFDVQPDCLRVGDVNGDLRDDVVVGGLGGVTTLLGDGVGGFSAQLFTPAPFAIDLALGFVDGDADLDVLVASGTVAQGPGQESGAVSVLLGNGDGSFTRSGSFSGGHCVASVLLGDLSQDGKADALVVTHEFDGGPGGLPQGRIALWLGNGLGGFLLSGVSPQHLFPDAGGIHPVYGALADVDNDLDLDAVYTSGDSLAYPLGTFGETHPAITAHLLRNDGAGSLLLQDLGTAYSGKGVSVLLEDLLPIGGDGLVDAVLVWYEDVNAGTQAQDPGLQTFLALLQGDGSAQVFDDPSPDQYALGDGAGDGALADINSDPLLGDGLGALDLLVPCRDDNEVRVLLGKGNGVFAEGVSLHGVDATKPQNLPPGTWVGGPRRLEVGPIAAPGSDGATVGFALAVYNAWEDLSPQPNPNLFASLSLFGGGLSGQFSKLQQLGLPRGGEFTQVDVDGDRRSDLVVSQFLGGAGGGAGDALHVYSGLAVGQPRVSTVPLVVPVPAGHALTGGLVTASLGGDAGPEVLTTSVELASGIGQLLVFASQAGVLQPAVAWPLGTSWGGIAGLRVGDVDGDGLLDALLGTDDGRLVFARQAAVGLDGDGAFPADVAFVPAPLPESIALVGGGALALGEITGDERLDVVSSNGAGPDGTGQAFVRTLQGGDGSFDLLQTVGGMASLDVDGKPLTPLLGDLDDDGTTEMLLIHGTANSVSVLGNQFDTFERFGSGKPGSGGFTPRLDGLGYTITGATATVVLEHGLGGAPALLVGGLGRTNLLFPAVAQPLLYFIVSLSGTPGAAGQGGFTLPVTLPGGPGLLDVEFTLQMAVLDAGAGFPQPFGFALSNGLAFTLVK